MAALAAVFTPAGAQQPKGAEKPQWVRPVIKADNLQHRTFASATLKGEVSYLIYLPPEYENARDKRYPVLYWLHGRGGSQQGVPAFTQRLTRAIEATQMPPLLVVFVNGLTDSGYEDRPGQPVETVSIKELLPHIDKTYRTVAAPAGRFVEGFTMGGGGAAKWGFKYPELFGAMSILAGARMTGEGASASALVKKNADAIRGKTAIRIIVGSQDRLVKGNRAYHELLEELKIPHEFHVIDGAGHVHPPLYEGLGERTVYCRLADPGFRRLREVSADMVQRTADMLPAAALEAVKTLLSLQKEAAPAAVRLGAARAVLEIGLRVREIANLETRLAALEAQLSMAS